ncbi:hypothetical protein ACLOJK_001091 [Asimina triloba]
MTQTIKEEARRGLGEELVIACVARDVTLTKVAEQFESVPDRKIETYPTHFRIPDELTHGYLTQVAPLHATIRFDALARQSADQVEALKVELRAVQIEHQRVSKELKLAQAQPLLALSVDNVYVWKLEEELTNVMTIIAEVTWGREDALAKARRALEEPSKTKGAKVKILGGDNRKKVAKLEHEIKKALKANIVGNPESGVPGPILN